MHIASGAAPSSPERPLRIFPGNILHPRVTDTNVNPRERASTRSMQTHFVRGKRAFDRNYPRNRTERKDRKEPRPFDWTPSTGYKTLISALESSACSRVRSLIFFLWWIWIRVSDDAAGSQSFQRTKEGRAIFLFPYSLISFLCILL